MIHTRNIQKDFRRGEHVEHALQNINVDVEEGEFVVVAGPSGSGKTTLLGILGLIDRPSGGEVFFRGTEVAHIPERQRDSIRRKNVAFVFEEIHLIDELTVFENIELPLLYFSRSRKERRGIVEKLMERFRLTHLKGYYPGAIGNFVQQKVALARAISCSPDVVFADEPAGRLNSSERGELMELFRELNEEGQTIVMATHSNDEARRGQRIIQLYDGHIASSSPGRS
ncbi:MAG: ABC transporter ATP-binding protein [Marinilabilia sp.]